MRIEFEQKGKTTVDVIGIEGNNRKIIGHIVTPSGSGGIYTNAIQVCGFDNAFQLWGCGIFGKLIREDKNHIKIKGMPEFTEEKKFYRQVKDIQLEFSMDTEVSSFDSFDGRCSKCYNQPCTCENKNPDDNPYNVKKEPLHGEKVNEKQEKK